MCGVLGLIKKEEEEKKLKELSDWSLTVVAAGLP
jgi:hypothetical protein